MDNFHFGDFNLSFEFDFQHDFTDNENQVIEDILTNPIESSELFETGESFGDTHSHQSSFFDYLCNDSRPVNDIAALDHLSRSQLLPFECNVDHQAADKQHSFANGSNGPEVSSADQNVNFDWTTFLDQSPAQSCSAEEAPSAHQRDDNASNALVNTNNDMIRDNGFIYQELKTLDVPQMYANLDQTFGLIDLKKIDESMDYSSLTYDNETCRDHRNNMLDLNQTALSKKKVFVMPLQSHPAAVESSRKVGLKLKSHPMILTKMLSQCANQQSEKKVLFPCRPKQIKSKSQRYLTIDEQLRLINTKEIVLPMNGPNSQSQKRKGNLKMDKAKVPAKNNLEEMLANIPDSNNDSRNEANTKKSARLKKVLPNINSTKCDDEKMVDELKTQSRRSNKKIRTSQKL